MRIVDVHSHYFSRTFFETLAVQAVGAEAAPARLDALAQETDLQIPDGDEDAHLARWLDEMDRHGVDHLGTFASLPQEGEIVARAVKAAGGRLSGFLMVDPFAPGAIDKLEGHLAAGTMRGALLFPAMHHVELGADLHKRLWQVLDDHEAIAFVHCGLLVVPLRDKLGLPRPYDLTYANPLSLIPVANRHRSVRFVVPHFGAGFLREVLMAGAQCENVYVDTSSSNGWVATNPGVDSLVDVFRAALGVFGPERILFGTDSGTFPAGWRAERLEGQQAALRAAGASTAAVDAVCGGSAMHLLGL